LRPTSRLRFALAACPLILATCWTLADNPATAQVQAQPADGAFTIKPYLQLGAESSADRLDLLWGTADADADWRVEYQPSPSGAYQAATAPTYRTVNLQGMTPHRVYRVTMTGLEPGSKFAYRVLKAGERSFESQGQAIKGPDQPYQFVVFGDIAAGTAEQKPMAFRAYESKPDFLMVTGDIVYDRGRATEYRDRYWPVYNNTETPNPSVGVPMMRSVPFVAAPGNHDTATRDLDRYPDGLAYFYYWDQPLNGPIGAEGTALIPKLTSTPDHRQPFVAAAGEAYPRMANFSFDYGNAHWLVLDANPYVDWMNKDLQSWVERDLADHQSATWRFVSYHQPGFNSAREHFEQQQMRTLAPVFEKGNVSVVFNGHVHNYQRSYPIRFQPDKNNVLLPLTNAGIPRGRLVNGPWTLDKSFDGATDTTPEGVIYIITGAGGQDLYNPEQQDQPDTWQGFTKKFVSKVHSLTNVEVDGKTLKVRQVTADGTELDRFTITK